LFSLSLLLTYQVLTGYYANESWALSIWVRLLEFILLGGGAIALLQSIRKAGGNPPASEVVH